MKKELTKKQYISSLYKQLESYSSVKTHLEKRIKDLSVYPSKNKYQLLFFISTLILLEKQFLNN